MTKDYSEEKALKVALRLRLHDVEDPRCEICEHFPDYHPEEMSCARKSMLGDDVDICPRFSLDDRALLKRDGERWSRLRELHKSLESNND